MLLDKIPIWLLSLSIIMMVLAAIEAGYQLGKVKFLKAEKETPVSAISGSILGLLGFILAFTFSMVYNRFETRKQLVREEANAIGTAYLRTDFLPEPDRAKARSLLRSYVDLRLAAAAAGDQPALLDVIRKSENIQSDLWQLAVKNTAGDLNTPRGALYLEALNNLIDIHSNRLAAGMIDRIPGWIWISLITLLLLGMASIGYLNAITSSKRAMVSLILAVSFSIVFFLIMAIDRPLSGMFRVSQQLLINARTGMTK